MQLTTLLTGAGIPTPVSGITQLEETILVGDIDTANPLQGLKINVGGETTIDIANSQPLITAYSKLFMPLVAGTVGLLIRVATGRVTAWNGPKASTNYTFTNQAATTPAIYAYSTKSFSPNSGQPAAPIKVVTDTINPLSNKVWTKFTALQVVMTNVSSFDVTFADGTTQNMSVVEMDSLFASENETEANGRLEATVTSIDNRDGKFKSVQVNAAATAVTLSIVSFPDMYFQTEKAAIRG